MKLFGSYFGVLGIGVWLKKIWALFIRIKAFCLLIIALLGLLYTCPGGWMGWVGGWLDYLIIKPAQPPIGVGAWAELGNIL